MKCLLRRYPFILVAMLLSLYTFGCSKAPQVSKPGDTDWPMYLHDSSNTGYTAGATRSLNRLIWERQYEYTGTGQALSNPIVAGDKVYVVSTNGYLNAIDIESGKQVWKVELQEDWAFNGLCSDGSMLFYRFGISTVAIDPNSHEIRWAKITKQGGWAGPPVLSKQRLFFGANDQNTYAMEQNNGEIVWKATLVGSPSERQPSCLTAKRVFQLSSGMDHYTHVYSLDAATGKRIWERKFDLENACTNTAFYRDRVFFGNGSTLYSVKASDGETLWSADRFGRIRSFIVDGDTIWVASNIEPEKWDVISVDVNTGQPGPVHATGNGPIVTSMIGSANLAVFGTFDNKLEVIDLHDGSLSKTLSPGNGRPANMAFSRDYLFVTTSDGRLLCFGP